MNPRPMDAHPARAPVPEFRHPGGPPFAPPPCSALRARRRQGCAYQKLRPYDFVTPNVGHDGRTDIPVVEPGCPRRDQTLLRRSCGGGAGCALELERFEPNPLPELIENASVTVAYSRLSGAIFERCRTQATKDNWSLASNNRRSPQLIRLRRGPNRVSDNSPCVSAGKHHEVTSWLILHQWPQLSAVR